MTLSGGAHSGDPASACAAGGPDAVYAVDLPKTSDLRVSAATNTGSYDMVLSLLGAPCGAGAEVTCADGRGAGGSESLSASDLPAGTYYVLVGGFGAADVGRYAITIDAVEVIPLGGACDPLAADQRCATGSACHAGHCEAPTDLLLATFDNSLLPFVVTDAGGDGESWYRCDPAGGCGWDNTTGSDPNDPYALVRDASGAALDGEALTSPVLDASNLSAVVLTWDHAFDHAVGCADLGAVEVSADGVSWSPVATFTADASGPATADISAQVAGHGAFLVRFRYDDQTLASADPFAKGWRIDNVRVYGF